MDREFEALADEHWEACQKGDWKRALEIAEELAQEAPDYGVQQYWFGRARIVSELVS